MVDRIGFNSPQFGENQPPERRVQFGALEHEMADEFVRVQRRELEAEAVERKQMELPWFDYLPFAYDEDDAKTFAKTQFGPPGNDAEISGQEFLNLLVTQEAIDPQDLPQEPQHLRYADYGVPETEIRQRLIDAGMPMYFYEDLLRLAHRDGLIYRMVDREAERTYYGVPHEVREALSLEQQESEPVAEVSKETGRDERGTFASALLSLAGKIEKKNDPELTEYGAELLHSARKAGLIEFEQISETFRAADVDVDLVSKLPDALMTLLESTFGTELFDETEQLAEKAVAADLMEEDFLVESLTEIREYNS